MNGFANSDTYMVALTLDNDFSLHNACQRIRTVAALRNLVWDAKDAGVQFNGADIAEVDFEELLDHVMSEIA